jgi:hypothetical protein
MNILKNCIKPPSYDIIQMLSPLTSTINISNLDKFKRLYDLIKNNYKIQEKKIKEITISDNKFKDIIKTLSNWRNIKQIKESLTDVKIIYQYQTKYLTLYYAVPSNINIPYATLQFHKIINIALTMESIIPNKKGTIYIYPIHYDRDLHVKKFNNKQSDIKYLEENYMAMTISGQVFKDNQTMFVVRDEECIKLFIHELLHLLEVDMIDNRFVGSIVYHLVENFNIRLTGGSFESYAELMSNILNIIFFVLNNNLDETMLNELFKIEIIYGIYSSAKLLFLYGYDENNFMNFFKEKNKELEVVNSIPSMYYYIVKSMYYFYFNEWIDLLDNNLKLNKDFFKKEVEIINKSINENSEYIKILKKCLELRKKTDDLTMRYSLIDDNCLSEMKGGSNKYYKKYIINLYKYVKKD